MLSREIIHDPLLTLELILLRYQSMQIYISMYIKQNIYNLRAVYVTEYFTQFPAIKRYQSKRENNNIVLLCFQILKNITILLKHLNNDSISDLSSLFVNIQTHLGCN